MQKTIGESEDEFRRKDNRASASCGGFFAFSQFSVNLQRWPSSESTWKAPRIPPPGWWLTVKVAALRNRAATASRSIRAVFPMPLKPGARETGIEAWEP